MAPELKAASTLTPCKSKRGSDEDGSTVCTPPKASTTMLHALVQALPQQSNKRLTRKRPLQDRDWFACNAEDIFIADTLIAKRIAEKSYSDRPIGHAAETASTVLDIITKGLGSLEGAENSCVLLMGEAASGKTHIVEYCLTELQERYPEVVVLRAQGSEYSCDVECLRHITLQVDRDCMDLPKANASFEQGMEWIRGVFRNSFTRGTTVIMVLEEFEYFCQRSRQTLLYNLFDITQEVGVRLSIIGTSEKFDVMDMLEKRIRSRFSMRHLHTRLPKNFDELLQILLAKLSLPMDEGLSQAFVVQFNRRLEAALQTRQESWSEQVELARPISWFLARCLPITALLRPLQEPRKRHHGGCAAGVANLPISTDRKDVIMLLLNSLSTTELIILLALQRLQSLHSARSLTTILYEVRRLHDEAPNLVDSYSQELYSAAFARLQELKLIDVRGSADSMKCHHQCRSLVVDHFNTLLLDMSAAEPDMSLQNPLRQMPAPVLQWAHLDKRA